MDSSWLLKESKTCVFSKKGMRNVGQAPCFVPPGQFVSGPSPWLHRHTLDLEVKASQRSKPHYGLECSSDFYLQGAFLHLCTVSFIRQGFSFLSPCHDYSFELRDKLAVYPVFLGCKFLNRSPPISWHAKRRVADCRCPTCGPSNSFLKSTFY